MAHVWADLVVRWLHATHEVGASVEARFHAASRMYGLAMRTRTPEPRRRLLHYALDVIVHDGRYRELPVFSEEQKRYWTLGSSIAKEITKYQPYLGIQEFWFAEAYEEAAARMAQ